MKAARASVTIGGRTHAIDARLGYKSSKKGVEYKPRLSVTTPESEVLYVDGTAEYSPGEKVSVNMKLDKVMKSPLTFKGKSLRVRLRFIQIIKFFILNHCYILVTIFAKPKV